MLIKTLVWSTPLYIYIYSSLSSGKTLTQFYIDPLWLCALPTWRIFFFTFLMTGAPMGRWYKDSVFFSEITDKNYNKPLVNIVFIRGRHLLVIMFASICGFKSRAAFNWVRYDSLQSLPAPQKKKKVFSRYFPTLKRQGCEYYVAHYRFCHSGQFFLEIGSWWLLLVFPVVSSSPIFP